MRVALAGALAALALAGCGGGTVTASAWGRQAVALCTKAAAPAARLDARRQTLAAQSGTAFYRGTATVLAREVTLDRSVLDGIDLLARPNADGGLIQTWLQLARQRVATTATLERAYAEEDDRAIAQNAEREDEQNQAADAVAIRLGQPGCAAIT